MTADSDAFCKALKINKNLLDFAKKYHKDSPGMVSDFMSAVILNQIVGHVLYENGRNGDDVSDDGYLDFLFRRAKYMLQAYHIRKEIEEVKEDGAS